MSHLAQDVRSAKDSGEVKRAKDDGRLPPEDPNTRIIGVGRDISDAWFVGEALARKAFHNVSYFSGSIQEEASCFKGSSQ